VWECVDSLSRLGDWERIFITGLAQQHSIQPDQFRDLSEIVIKVRSGNGGVAQG
jgi:hypothetical protein